jgi:hypothetical protein
MNQEKLRLLHRYCCKMAIDPVRFPRSAPKLIQDTAL